MIFSRALTVPWKEGRKICNLYLIVYRNYVFLVIKCMSTLSTKPMLLLVATLESSNSYINV